MSDATTTIEETKNNTVATSSIPQQISSIINSEHLAPQRSLIGKAIFIKGDLAAQEDMVVDGRLEGTITLKNNILEIGLDAQIEANLFAKVIVIDGELKGDAHASQQIVIRKSAHVTGNIYSADVTIEDGATLKGYVDMEKQDISQHHSIFDTAEDRIETSDSNRPSSFLNKVLEITHLQATNNNLPEIRPQVDSSAASTEVNNVIVHQPMPEKSFLGETVMLRGDFNSEEDVEMQGKFEGVIYFKNNHLEVGSKAQIKATTFVKSLTSCGELKGDIYASEQVVIRKGGHVFGRIHSPRVSLASGAILMGNIEMEPQDLEKTFSEIVAYTKSKDGSHASKKAEVKAPAANQTPKAKKAPARENDIASSEINIATEKFRSLFNPGE